MRFTQSLRWRIQLWHGALLIVVLSALGIAAYRYQGSSETNRIDQEIQERIAVLFAAMPKNGPPRPPPPSARARPDADQPRPRPREFRLEPEQAALFSAAGGYYFVVWRPDGLEVKRSANCPANIPPPVNLDATNGATSRRTRGVLREAFAFTPPSECILVGHSMAPELAALSAYARWLGVIGGSVLLVGLGGGWWLATRAIRPVKAITETALRIADGRLNERIDVGETDSELGRLALLLNSTFARLETSFSRQARFTADAAHELRTPVSIVVSQAQLGLRGTRSVEELREMLSACLRAGRRMEQLTQALLTLERQDAQPISQRREPCDLAALANEATALLANKISGRGITIHRELDSAPCHADPDELMQVILNLLTNAIDHSPEAGFIFLRSTVAEWHAELAITDQGPGIAPEHLPRLGERFYRADPSRNHRTGGAGLGLAICKSILAAYGGGLRIASDLGNGSTFSMCLPVAGH